MSIEITLKQAQALVEYFGGETEQTLTLVEGDESFHSGKGLYVHDEYPEHGCLFLGKEVGGKQAPAELEQEQQLTKFVKEIEE